MTRSAALAAPLRELLSAPRREDVARAGAGAPDLPATITAEALAFAYTPGSEPIFRNVACAWSSGAPLVIVGPNGSGKSTLLRLLVGLRRPTEGVVRVAGRDLAEIDARDLRRQVAYLPQRPYLGEPYTSVRSALGFASAHVPDDAAMMRALDRTRVAEALAQRPRGMLDAAVGQLSVGQRQRVALARLLLQDAAVFLLDEPDANLDRAGIELVAALVAELIAEGKMVAIAAHTPELAAIGGARVTLG